MDFSLSKEQEKIQAEAAAIAAELPSDLVEKDRQSTFDAEAWGRPRGLRQRLPRQRPLPRP